MITRSCGSTVARPAIFDCPASTNRFKLRSGGAAVPESGTFARPTATSNDTTSAQSARRHFKKWTKLGIAATPHRLQTALSGRILDSAGQVEEHGETLAQRRLTLPVIEFLQAFLQTGLDVLRQRAHRQLIVVLAKSPHDVTMMIVHLVEPLYGVAVPVHGE